MGTKPVGSWLRIGINPSLEDVVWQERKVYSCRTNPSLEGINPPKWLTRTEKDHMQVTKRK